MDSKSGGDPNKSVALLTAVRTAHQSGFDRVVFEFANHVSAYTVGYISGPLLADGSGAVVPVAGSVHVLVHMQAASGYDAVSSGGYRQIYMGPQRLPGPGSPVVEVVELGDFEAVLNWAVGLTSTVPFQVSVYSSPPRLVLDFQST